MKFLVLTLMLLIGSNAFAIYNQEAADKACTLRCTGDATSQGLNNGGGCSPCATTAISVLPSNPRHGVKATLRDATARKVNLARQKNERLLMANAGDRTDIAKIKRLLISKLEIWGQPTNQTTPQSDCMAAASNCSDPDRNACLQSMSELCGNLSNE